MLDVKQLATELSKTRNQPLALWTVALEKSAGLIDRGWLTENQLVPLAKAALAPRQLLVLVDYAARQPQGRPGITDLFDRVDESDYTLTDWLKAIESFHDWISSRTISTDLDMLLGYISCCTEANPNSPTELNLKETVLEMLEQYGFEG